MKAKLLFALAGFVAILSTPPNPAGAADMHLGLFDDQAVITILGGIEAGDDERFMEVLREGVRASGFVSVVNIFSRGGSVDAAINIGRAISDLSITTVVPFQVDEATGTHECRYRPTGAQTDTILTRNFQTGAGDRACTCMSACFLIWSAGAERQGHYIGIHRTYFRPESFGADSFSQARERFSRLRLNVEDYLRSMNIPDLVIDTMYSVASDQIEPLDQEFIDILRTDPALEEYLNARCQAEFRSERDLRREAARLSAVDNPSFEQLSRAAEVQLQAIEASITLNDCRHAVRRVIFAEAWAADYAQPGDVAPSPGGAKN
ncbi:MAG: hypothetical protein ACFB01_00255 [Cohaesibacteraceae bacterium]